MSKLFEKYLGNHLNVELRKDPIFFHLKINESHGVVDFIEHYKNIIFNYLYNTFPLDFDDRTEYEFEKIIDVYKEYSSLNQARIDYISKKNQDDCHNVPFFRNLDIYVKVIRSSDISMIGGYIPAESKYKDDCEGTVCIGITVNCLDFDTALCMIDRNIEHEFIHALEDCERRKHTGVSLADKIKRDNYNKYLYDKNIRDPYENIIGTLLYDTYDSEINASIGGLNSELKKNKEIIRKKDDSNSIMELIKSSSAYKKVINCHDNIKYLEWIIEPERQEELLDYANKLRINRRYKENKRLKPFKSYNDMLNHFRNQTYKFERRLIEKGIKLAYDIFNEYGFYAHWDRHPSFEMMNEMFGKYMRKLNKMKEEERKGLR